MSVRQWVVGGGVLATILLVGYGAWGWYGKSRTNHRHKQATNAVRVVVVNPAYTEFDRKTVEQGTVYAVDTVELFAEVSGTLQIQDVDIGDLVQQGQVLSRIRVPEVEQELAKAKASALKARARVLNTTKAVSRYQAELKVAKEQVPAAESALENARATRRYRVKQLDRVKDLRRQNAVDGRLVDEQEERKDAALATEQAALSALSVARAQIEAAESKLEQTKADVQEANAEVGVADAEVEKMKARLDFSYVRAPFNGVITRRNFSVGAFIRSAAQGEKTPLFALDRIDKMRVVVHMPDRHIPYTDKGDPASVEVGTLNGKVFEGKICRTQAAEDHATRTMRVEIDLDNTTRELRAGMFAKVNFSLQRVKSAMVLPSGCLIGEAKAGNATIAVVREGKAKLTPIKIGVDNGVVIEVLSGVSANDEVVRKYSGTMADGVPVRVEQDAGSAASNNH